VACYGVLTDYSTATGLCFKAAGNVILLVGRRTPGLAGSALYAALGAEGGVLPAVDLDRETRNMHAVTEMMIRRLALACHDISEGGLVTALAEMVMGGWGVGRIGAEVEWTSREIWRAIRLCSRRAADS